MPAWKMTLNSDPCQFDCIVKPFFATVILGLDPRVTAKGMDDPYCGASEPRMSAQKRLALPAKDELRGVWLSPSEAASS